MKQNSENFRSNCPINFVLEIFGDKWTLLIVRDLMFKSKRSYGEFLQSNEKISTNILADRLQKLEAAGIAIKEIDKQNKSKFIYALTDKGKDFLPIMLEITAWSCKHDATTNTPDSFIEAFEKDKLALSIQILDNLK
ncbi:helix-turn-helix transcriptional regulator [Pseudoalteromonas sp. C2R02]|uniref:winged helix-turn-helix transcriptional regulator n=1 Tax=Pseudoalteromonas sp. C2R02 TaxID=2841565 RepID=UPI001C0896F8|nr:helix-turn-helix domain-containing protein [Pseudoalteromonas sp. C2R02]MBU2970833.1 helix-turn-helix transcriptional regulator [Pseudoalteromonas sp. C2R02]